MEETMDSVNWLKVSFMVAGCGLAIYLGNEFYPDVKWFFPPALVLIFAFIFFWGAGKWIVWMSRYKSYQVNVNGCHGSVYGKPEYVPDPSCGAGFVWAVFNLGHSTFPISLRGKLGTLVVPGNQVYPAGKGFVGLTLVQKWSLGSLPYPVQRFLRKNEADFNLDNIYFGKYSQEFVDKSGSERDLNAQITAQNNYIGVLEKTVEHDFGHFEEIKELSDRLNKTPNFIQKMTKKVMDKGEEGG